MLAFNEFCIAVQDCIRDTLPEKYVNARIELYTSEKTNGVQKTGLIINSANERIYPVIYLEEFYQQFQSGVLMSEVCKTISDIYEKNMEKSFDLNHFDLRKWEQVKDKVSMRLINSKENRNLLSSVPFKQVDDLAVVYRIDVPIKDDLSGQASMMIRNEHMGLYGITKEELFDVAYTNTKVLHPPLLMCMDNPETLFFEPENLLEGGPKNGQGFMYILTNKEKSYGAVSMLYPEVMEQTKEIMGEDFYILPSSLHETILVPKSMEDARNLGIMVREVNANEVKREEVLSDHVYEFNFSEKQIQSVKESMLKQREVVR